MGNGKWSKSTCGCFKRKCKPLLWSYDIFSVLVWSVSDKTNYFIETQFFLQMVYSMGNKVYGEWFGSFCHNLKVRCILFYILEHLRWGKGTWSSFPADFMAFFFLKGIPKHFKTKQGNQMFLILYPRQPVLLLVSGLSSFSFDGPPGLARLVIQHVYLAFGCESTQTHIAASTSA